MNQITAGNSVSARGGAARPDGLAEGIARLRRALRRGARVADPGNPLAVAQLELLSALTEHPGARPGQLARLLHMRPNTVTTIVNTLTAQGMVSRATADGDRRAVELTATDSRAAGRARLAGHQRRCAAPGPVHPARSPAAGAGRRGTRPRRPRQRGQPARRQPPRTTTRAGHTMTRNPARVPPPSRPAPPTRSWYATAGAAAVAALMLLAWHANSLITAAGLFAAGATATALAEAHLRSRQGRSTGIAPTGGGIDPRHAPAHPARHHQLRHTVR